MAAHMKIQNRDGLGQGEELDEDDKGFFLDSERLNEDEGSSEMGKLTKRGFSKARRAPSVCSSVRGSTIALSGLRLRRASQLAGRRRGPSTPVPSWKLVSDAFANTAPSETLGPGHEHHQHQQVGRPSVAVISARRLAATLWELQPVPFSRGGASRNREPRRYRPRSSLTAKPSVLLSQAQSPASNHISQRLLKTPSIPHKMQIEAERKVVPLGSPAPYIKSLWKDLGQGPASSNEFSKVLNHVRSLEEQHKSSMLLIDNLRHELNHSHSQMQELMQNEKKHRMEVEDITKKLVEERAMWQGRQEESVGIAVQNIKEELYYERKVKSRLESLHRRMVKEYHELKKALGKALHDLERERKARELMEDVCDELAREIGEDKARVEEMKRESAKVREEVEEERKMLQMAEIWREERVQMKLMEAKLELEEKNTALDKLRGELEAFLKAKRAANARDEGNLLPGDARQDIYNRLSTEAIVGRNLTDSFRPREARVPARYSVDSGHSNVSWPKQRQHDFEDDDVASVGEDDVIDVLEKQVASDRSQHQYHQKDSHEKDAEDRGRRSSHQRAFHAERSKQLGTGRYQGLQRTRSSQLRDGSRHGEHYLADMQDTEWIEGDVREWSEGHQASAGDGREETLNTWPSENEGSQGHSSFSPRPAGRNNELAYEDMSNLESSGTNAAWLRQIVETSRDLPATSVFAPIHQQLYVKSSPTRQWNHFWSSPDPGSPRQGKGKGSSEMSGRPRDNSLKAKLLEAKLEGQQARLRASMG